MKIQPTCLGLTLLALAACSSAKPQADLPPLVPVQGQVTRASKPVTNGLLRFRLEPESPESRDWVISAEIQPDGTFEIQTVHSLSQKRAKGAPTGTYKVTYTSSGDQTQGARLELLTLPQTVTIQSELKNLQVILPPKKS
jgi:hypothetical protein